MLFFLGTRAAHRQASRFPSLTVSHRRSVRRRPPASPLSSSRDLAGVARATGYRLLGSHGIRVIVASYLFARCFTRPPGNLGTPHAPLHARSNPIAPERNPQSASSRHDPRKHAYPANDPRWLTTTCMIAFIPGMLHFDSPPLQISAGVQPNVAHGQGPPITNPGMIGDCRSKTLRRKTTLRIPFDTASAPIPAPAPPPATDRRSPH